MYQIAVLVIRRSYNKLNYRYQEELSYALSR